MPTASQIDAARTPKGGWTKATLAGWGVSWPPPKGWRERLIAEAAALPPTDGEWPLLLLRPQQCRFICTPHYGPRTGHRYCGRLTSPDAPTPYCEAHRAIVYRPGTVQIEEAEAEGIAA